LAERKTRVQAGRVVTNSDGVQVAEIATSVARWVDPGSVEQVTAAFSHATVAVRTVQGPSQRYDANQAQVSQVVLSREDFDTLIASYRAYVRAEQKSCAGVSGRHDDFDPFLDADDL